MNKEKDIRELTEELEKGRDYPYINTPREMAERLVQVGFGDIKRARKEAAIEIFDEVSKHLEGSWLVELYKKYAVEE